MVSVYLIPQAHYEKCFTMSVALVNLVSFTCLSLANWQKKDLSSMFDACYRIYLPNFSRTYFLHIPKVLITLFQDHQSHVTCQMSTEECHLSLTPTTLGYVQTHPSSSFHCKQNISSKDSIF